MHKKRQTRKVFFSTDLTLSARDIFDIYRTRFQLEFVFRDAKQFTGLTHLSSVNVARAFAREQGINLSVGSTKTLLHNAAMLDRFSKNFHSTAFAPWRNFYKINELLLQ